MAELVRTCNTRNGQSNTWNADMDHYLHDYHLTYRAVCPLLDQSDVHDELHYSVRRFGTSKGSS